MAVGQYLSKPVILVPCDYVAGHVRSDFPIGRILLAAPVAISGVEDANMDNEKRNLVIREEWRLIRCGQE